MDSEVTEICAWLKEKGIQYFDKIIFKVSRKNQIPKIVYQPNIVNGCVVFDFSNQSIIKNIDEAKLLVFDNGDPSIANRECQQYMFEHF